MNNNIKNNNLIFALNEIMEERFGKYAKYIIQDRALPDVRDGLKPVQRRILYAMNDLNLLFNLSYKKSARIVGEVIGKYHPHGDTSVYDAIVRLSQWWKLRYPLIDMHGNNGSIDGDPAAAMRYTEIRLSQISSFLLKDLNKNTVIFSPNFDDSESEPTILPSMFPNLLLNGATGIAAGYATNIPPHNLEEVILATIYRIKNPNCKINDLIKIIKGPDFPTGGIIQGKKGILDAYKTGKGKIIIRSNIIEKDNKLIINQIPYEVIKQDLVKKIDDVKYNEPGLYIKEVRDETDRSGLRIVIELGKKANIDLIRKYLLKNTNLQISYNFNMVAIANKKPKLLSLIELLDHYINHQKEVVINRSKYEFSKANKRLEIVNGLIKSINILDKIISIIRNSENKKQAIDNLCNNFNFTFTQSEAIVNLKLYRLTSTDFFDLKSEEKELNIFIKDLNFILTDKNKMFDVIIEQLILIKNKFNSKRKSKIQKDIEILEIEKTKIIIEKELNIWISKDGYIKAIENNQFNKINNFSFDNFKRKPQDIWISNIIGNTLDKILLITSKGKYVIIPIYKIKLSKIKDIGFHINNLVELSSEEKIISCYLFDNFVKKEKDYYIMIATKFGMIKLIKFQDFEAIRISKSIKAINLKIGDEVINSELFFDQKNLLIFTKNGLFIKYKNKDLLSSISGLKTLGFKMVNLSKDDFLINVFLSDINEKEEEEEVLIITNKNKVKKINLKNYSFSSKNKPYKGINIFKNNNKNKKNNNNEFLKWSFLINKKNELLYFLKSNNKIIFFEIKKISIKLFGDNEINLFNILDISNDEKILEIYIQNYYNLK